MPFPTVTWVAKDSDGIRSHVSLAAELVTLKSFPILSAQKAKSRWASFPSLIHIHAAQSQVIGAAKGPRSQANELAQLLFWNYTPCWAVDLFCQYWHLSETLGTCQGQRSSCCWDLKREMERKKYSPPTPPSTKWPLGTADPAKPWASQSHYARLGSCAQGQRPAWQ